MSQRLTIISLFCVLPWKGQAQNISRPLLHKAVDYYHFMMVRFILGFDKGGLDAFQHSFSRSAITDTTFSRIHTAIPPQKEKVLQLSDEIESIKSYYPIEEPAAKLPLHLATLVHNDKITDQQDEYRYPMLHRYYMQFRGHANFILLQKVINTRLHAMVSVTTNEKQYEPSSYSHLKTNNMIDWITEHAGGFIIFFLILLWYVTAYIKSNTAVQIMDMKKQFEQQAKAKDISQIRDLTIQAGTEIINLQNVVGVQHQRLLELEQQAIGGIWGAYLEVKDDVQKVSTRLQQAEDALRKLGARSSPAQPSVTPLSADGLRRLFFPLPDQKTGQFRASLGKDNISSYSIYQFNLSPEGNKATFQLLASPEVEAMVLNFPQSYLRHTSDTEGTPGINKKIEVVQPGEAERQENYWIITKKGVIRYV
jgi:hypothetical protein